MRRASLLRKLLFCLLVTTIGYAAPVRLRCEYRDNPLGIDVAAPHLSWQSDNAERDWRQSAYQILVATSAAKLQGTADVWDSGRQSSAESVGIPYGGPPLESRKRYYWTVRVWDSKGKQSEASAPGWWEMALLKPADWNAKWITWKNTEDEADRAVIRWIWLPGQNASTVPVNTTAVFRLSVDVAQKPRSAVLFATARGNFQARLNGQVVAAKRNWNEFDRHDIGDVLLVGKNSLEVTVNVPEPSERGPNPGAEKVKAALAVLVKITQPDGSIVRVGTDGKWQSKLESSQQWTEAAVAGVLGGNEIGDAALPQPAGLLRHNFTISKKVQSARLYVTALGSYRAFINGRRVGQDVLTPEFSDYSKRVLYQTYDVTDLLSSGKNAIAAMLGDGWFASGLTWEGQPFFFQTPPKRLMAQLEVEYADGGHDTVASDGSWKAAQAPIVHSEIYSGEVYDARLEQAGWNQSGFEDTRWSAASVSDASPIAITSQMTAPPKVTETLVAKSVTPVGKGVYVFDMGQNMVGWVTLKVAGPAGTGIRLRFAERLNPDGTIYTENLRNANVTDRYFLRGGSEETFTPHFTFHGFRYVEVVGYPGTPSLQAIKGEVVSSVSGEPVGKLTTSSELVNRMWSIGIWGQRGNFLSVPTDCPQRDERLGWMGDAGVFWRTGSYNYDIEAFTHKWMQDVVDAQTPQGAFTNVSPDVLRPYSSEGAPGWGDAGVIVPYTAWLQYGDRAIITDNWEAMQRWMKFIRDANPDFLRKNGVGPNFADWLAPDENTNKDLLATAYWALIAKMMAEMAHAIGKEDEATQYTGVYDNIRAAFQKEYIKDNGEVGTGTQTSYVVALYTKMAPKELEPALVNNLVKDIESRQWHLSTGFLGTPFLLFTLANHGRADVAYRLLLNETYPSWGYMLSKGATTWWERWNGDTGDPAMNSYNHYAFGSVVAWVYRSVAGIDTTADAPGFREIVVRPLLDRRINHARGEYDSVYGKIMSEWNGTPSGPFALKVTIPANTTARVYLPAISNARVTKDGKPLDAKEEAGSYMVQVGSGSYEFAVK